MQPKLQNLNRSLLSRRKCNSRFFAPLPTQLRPYLALEQLGHSANSWYSTLEHGLPIECISKTAHPNRPASTALWAALCEWKGGVCSQPVFAPPNPSVRTREQPWVGPLALFSLLDPYCDVLGGTAEVVCRVKRVGRCCRWSNADCASTYWPNLRGHDVVRTSAGYPRKFDSSTRSN